jgi:Tol biopolymer transport system component
MKTLLKSSIVLIVFSLSIILFNISCEKKAEAQPNTTVATAQNVGLVFFRKDGAKDNEFWKANYDGTNQVKVTIASFPAGMELDIQSFRVSPDGKKAFFVLYSSSGNSPSSMYSCDIDGSGIKKIVDQIDEIYQAI